MPTETVRVAILGASGYTGADAVRLALTHPGLSVAALTADRQAGRPIEAVFPHLGGFGLPPLARIEQVDWAGIDAVLCCLPHGTTQEVVAGLPRHLKVVDLSADFRLRDPAVYAEWYGHEHRALALQAEAVYGLTELNRAAVAGARLVACPGCYPTAVLLALLPPLSAQLIDPESLVVDAKSGVSGAGRSLKEAYLFCEVGEGVHAYGVGRHRHMPEMEQELAAAAGRPVTLSFTPHLVPMNRGELVSAYVRLAEGVPVEAVRACLGEAYAGEPFVRLLPEGAAPATRHVRGSNRCDIAVFADRRPGHAIILSAIDNLVKGSSGQAIQNLNLMLGLPEAAGLHQVALFP